MTESPDFSELEFLSIIENINLIDAMVDQIETEYGLEEEVMANIRVALSEAVNNAIIHGNKSNPRKKVKVRFVSSGKEFTFIVEDEGDGFDLDQVKDPTAPENLDKPTGRGIFLMRHLADHIEYLENGKKVIISFFRS